MPTFRKPEFRGVEFTIKGITPTLLHNGQLADPACEYSMAMKEITAKRTKTPDDYRRLADLEWEGSLYLDAEHRVVIPGYVIQGALCLAGKKIRKGADVRSALSSPGNWLLEYKGPKKLDQLKADPAFRDRRGVKVNKGRVMRTRPIFHEWTLTFRLTYRPDLLDRDTLVRIVEILGFEVGLSDDRGLMGGRFSVEKVNDVA